MKKGKAEFSYITRIVIANFIYNSEKLETAHISINRRMGNCGIIMNCL